MLIRPDCVAVCGVTVSNAVLATVVLVVVEVEAVVLIGTVVSSRIFTSPRASDKITNGCFLFRCLIRFETVLLNESFALHILHWAVSFPISKKWSHAALLLLGAIIIN